MQRSAVECTTQLFAAVAAAAEATAALLRQPLLLLLLLSTAVNISDKRPEIFPVRHTAGAAMASAAAYVECNSGPGCFDYRQRCWNKCGHCGTMATPVTRRTFVCAACFWEHEPNGKQCIPCPGSACRKWVADAKVGLAKQLEGHLIVAASESPAGAEQSTAASETASAGSATAPNVLRAELDAAFHAQQQQQDRIVILEAEMQRVTIDTRASTVTLEAQVQRLHAAIQSLELKAEETAAAAAAAATTTQQRWDTASWWTADGPWSEMRGDQ